MSSFKRFKFEELFDVTSGLSKPREDFGFGHPFLSYRDIYHNYYLEDELEELANTTAQERDRCSVKRGDIFLTRTSETVDELGMSCVALKDYPNATFNGFAKRLRLKTDINVKIHPEFIAYYLRSHYFRQQVDSMAVMTTRASLNNEMIERLFVDLPPFAEQVKSADVLKTLDDKIKINKKSNEKLEETLKAIFKEWFVDFGPVKAKAKGKKPSGMDSKIASLFPAKFEQTEFGLLPNGWKFVALEEIVSLIIDHRGKTPAKLGFDWIEHSTCKAYSAKNIKGNRLVSLKDVKYVSEDLYRKWMKDELQKYDILMTSEGPMGEFLFLRENVKWVLSQRLYAIRVNEQICSPDFLFQWFQTDKAKHDLNSRATGTTVTGIRQSELRKVSILHPTIELTKAFSDVAGPMFQAIWNNEIENHHLESLRNLLLPKLLSGKAEFTEASS